MHGLSKITTGHDDRAVHCLWPKYRREGSRQLRMLPVGWGWLWHRDGRARCYLSVGNHLLHSLTACSVNSLLKTYPKYVRLNGKLINLNFRCDTPRFSCCSLDVAFTALLQLSLLIFAQVMVQVSLADCEKLPARASLAAGSVLYS